MRRFLTTVMLFLLLVSTSCQIRTAAVGEETSAEAAGNVSGEAEETLQEEAAEASQEKAADGAGGLQVHFIDVGQADATLILCDGHAMLFDTGGNETGVLLQLYLMELGIERLDYVIGSHPEADHIGGMDVLLLKYDCGAVMLPDVEIDTDTCQDVLEVMEEKHYEAIYPAVGEVYLLGSASFTIIAPNGGDYGDNINNYSVGIRLTYGEDAFLFTGDAEAQAEKDILNNGLSIDADVLKVGHHGSSDASSPEFVEAVSPAYAVISCGKENDYGHPHEKTLKTLEAVGAMVFRTDEQGTIVASSDGAGITWELKAWDPEEAGKAQGIYYVGNKSNGKLHVSTCTSLPMEWNQVIFSTKEEAVQAGFSDFCGGCRP